MFNYVSALMYTNVCGEQLRLEGVSIGRHVHRKPFFSYTYKFKAIFRTPYFSLSIWFFFEFHSYQCRQPLITIISIYGRYHYCAL